MARESKGDKKPKRDGKRADAIDEKPKKRKVKDPSQPVIYYIPASHAYLFCIEASSKDGGK